MVAYMVKISVKAKNASSKEKCLGDVHEYTIGDILNADCLVPRETDRRGNEHYCTYGLDALHVLSTSKGVAACK